jgi:hypothetical protein
VQCTAYRLATSKTQKNQQNGGRFNGGIDFATSTTAKKTKKQIK